MLVDSHCHLDFSDLAENLSSVLDLMRSNDVAGAVCIGVTLEELPRVLSLAETHRHIFASVGVHPETTDIKEPTVAELVRLAQHSKVVAIAAGSRLAAVPIPWQER